MPVLQERIGASNVVRKIQTEIDNELDRSWRDTPINLRLYQLHLRMQEPQKRMQIYKKSTQTLVHLCEPYARHCLDISPKVLSRDERFWDIFRWYLDLLSALQHWSPLDSLLLLLSHDNVRRDIGRIGRTIPSELVDKAAEDDRPHLQSAYYDLSILLSTGVRFEETFDLLQALLSSENELRDIVRLKGANAQIFIDLLDKTMDHNEVKSQLYTHCLRTLRRLCGRSTMLPTSCILSKNLEKVGTEAFTSGGFADVWLGTYNTRTVALKVLRVHGRDSVKVVKKTFYREAVLWKRLSHPNIVPFLGASTTLFPLCMVCEWMKNGNIITYLKKNPNAKRLDLAIDITKGLQFLHSLGVLHGDLKGANVLINDELHACLSDFGLTAVTYDPNTVNAITASSVILGSYRWMAPEIFHPEQSGLEKPHPLAESDIYAFGMTLWEVFTGHVPFHQYPRDATVLFKVMLGIRPERPHEAAVLGLTDIVWKLMEMCWHADWRKRPRISFVLQCLEEAVHQFVPSPGSQIVPISVAFDEHAEDVQSEGSDEDEDDTLFEQGADELYDHHLSASRQRGGEESSREDFAPGPFPEFAASTRKQNEFNSSHYLGDGESVSSDFERLSLDSEGSGSGLKSEDGVFDGFFVVD